MKKIICFGDSNTFGYSGDPTEQKGRFNQKQRWPVLLQNQLGDTFSIKEEGCNGRTIQFIQENHPTSSGIHCISDILQNHSPISLLIIMLGSNDTQERFNANPEDIAYGLRSLVKIAQSEQIWQSDEKNILIISPPAMQPGFYDGPFSGLMGKNAVEKSNSLSFLFKSVAKEENCCFFDANIEEITEYGINKVDCLHLNLHGHQTLSKKLLPIIKELFSN